MRISFDRDVLGFGVEDTLHNGRLRYSAVLPLQGASAETNVALHYSRVAPPVEGKLLPNLSVDDGSDEGWVTEIVVESEDLAGVLAAEATARLAGVT